MDDLEFIQRCICRDKQSWEQFIEKYSRLIYNYIQSSFKVKGILENNQSKIDDLFQDILLSLVKDDFKKLRSFQAKNNCTLASWLRQVTINATIDYIRRMKPEVSWEEKISEDRKLIDTLVDSGSDNSEKIVRDEEILHLKDCINRLGTEDIFFLELHLNRGLNLEELKDFLRLSRGAVDMRKTRIIERLKQCFKDKGFI